ncbi:Rab geranylgeranyltransferase [Cryptosporidium ryanae]|uniref:Rab geranylgeranyltransferase n=1 Tax=Cryptosporidium ryanae TaxID=515981 RepID=UPI00351A8B07|nr:Rab geranylgeranyltransferase [Cryptosporidium ryanae]
MHGRSKSEYKELTEAEKEHMKRMKDLFEECSKAISDDRKSNSYSESTFRKTEKLLKLNPEIPTFWNYRKKFIENIVINKETSKIVDIINDEFSLTESLFKVDPKSYSLWSNRVWLIELVLNTRNIEENTGLENKNVGSVDLFQLENGYLKEIKDLNNFYFSEEFKQYLSQYNNVYLKMLANELDLCKKLLNFDDRNFHCWKHRSFVLTCLKYLSVKYSWSDFSENLHYEEFKFLNNLIQNNFSNYSAWHQRILLSGNKHLFDTLDDFNREVKLVHTAIFTEPNDQSIWQYYSWLMEKLLPKIIFKDTKFNVCPRFFIKTVKLSSNLKDGIEFSNKNFGHSISIKLSNYCFISQEYSNVMLVLNNNLIPIKNGNWIPIYQECDNKIDENSFRFINKRLPSNFRSKTEKKTDNWKFVFDFEESNLNTKNLTLKELIDESSIKIIFDLFSSNSDDTLSCKPMWNLENELYSKEFFSSKTLSPKFDSLDNKKYQFIIQKEEYGDTYILKCRYNYCSDYFITSDKLNIDNTILDNLNTLKTIIISEFDIIREIQELEPDCKYPILSLKKLYDIFNLCIPYELSQTDKILFNTELVNNLYKIDPLRKGYYNEKFKNDIYI